MSDTIINILLSTQTSPSAWGNKNLLSFEAEQVTIHVSDPKDLRKIQLAGRKVESLGLEKIQLIGEHWSLANQWAFAQGFTSPKKLNHHIIWQGDEATIQQLQQQQDTAAWVRELSNLGPEQLQPQHLSERVGECLYQLAPKVINYKIIQGQALEEQGFIGIYAVGRGSNNPPTLLELDYNPSQDPNAPVDAVLVGKGITFDSGGYSLKSSAGMLSMKFDMCGAATVAGAMAQLIKQKVQQRVVLILCCAENLVSGHAYKLGDVLTYKNGTTVEIVNTDAEGRLVLADGLIRASELSPKLIVDAATLTGAAMIALDDEYNGVFTLNDQLAAVVEQAANKVNEPAWRLPLASWHKNKFKTPYADTANSRAAKGGGGGGASNAAGFLSRFVDDPSCWVHLDLAVAFDSQSSNLWSAGSTASGVGTISELVKLYTEK